MVEHLAADALADELRHDKHVFEPKPGGDCYAVNDYVIFELSDGIISDRLTAMLVDEDGIVIDIFFGDSKFFTPYVEVGLWVVPISLGGEGDIGEALCFVFLSFANHFYKVLGIWYQAIGAVPVTSLYTSPTI